MTQRPQKDQELVGDLLTFFRQRRGLTQRTLAELLRRPQSFVSKYERAERTLSLPELRDVCDALKVSLWKLVWHFDDGGLHLLAKQRAQDDSVDPAAWS
jgi:transcriptional regulator with XRE-family HTH domain